LNYSLIFDSLEANQSIFQNLLLNQSEDAYLYRPHSEHWCLLEIVCHLYDEEKEDFRLRLKTILESPGIAPPPIDPEAWVKERKYIERNYEIMVHKFLDERTRSIEWLRSLNAPQWDNFYQHVTLGKLSAHLFISNWLAHDYLHIRQITRVKYTYLKSISKEDVSYAGKW